MEIVSGLGDGIFWVGLIAVLIDRDASEVWLALAAAARLGPRALLSAPAGVLADRVDRRALLVALDLARCATLLGVALITASGGSSWLIIAAVAVTYTFAAPYRPALTAALPAVVGEGALSSTNALIATVRQVMTFVGPVVGAAVVGYGSPTMAFVLDALSFALSALLVASVAALSDSGPRTRQTLARHRSQWRRELREGWAEIRAAAGLASVVALVFVMYAARGAELILLVLVAEHNLELGAAGIGVLMGAIGLGALFMLPHAPRYADSNHPALVMTASVAATAVPYVVLAETRSLGIAVAACVVLGASVVMFEMLSTVLLQRLTRRDCLGRVFGLVGTASNAGKLAGALAAPAWPGLATLTSAANQRRRQLLPTVNRLATLGIFDGTSRAAIERVAACVVRTEVSPGTVVVREGDAADELYAMVDGEVSVTKAGEEVNLLRADDWFGEIGLLQRRPRNATVTASAHSVLWRIPGSVFLDSLAESAAAPATLIEVMAERLGQPMNATVGR
jgi:MFS family permease